MLGKLIKYDIKSLNRFLIIIHAFLLLFAVLIRFFITRRITKTTFSNTPDDTFMLFFMLAFTLGILFISAISFATALLIAVRFYKHLFSDEGYLTHTLPVTSGQHLLAKTISGTIWGCIDILLICVSIYIAVATPYIKGLILDNEAELLEAMGCTGAYANLTITHLLVGLVILYLFSTIPNVIMYYASIALGQFFSNHRVVGAVVSYIGITTVTSIISLVFLMVSGAFRFYLEPNTVSQMAYIISSMKVSSVIGIISTVILYIVTYYILDKKVNLN